MDSFYGLYLIKNIFHQLEVFYKHKHKKHKKRNKLNIVDLAILFTLVFNMLIHI